MLSLNVLLYVLIIAIFKTIVFFICAISVLFDNMLNQIKSNQIKSNHFSKQVLIILVWVQFPLWINRPSYLGSVQKIRGQNTAGSRANCSQNLTHRMLRTEAQMALENIGSFQYLILEKSNLALKKV